MSEGAERLRTLRTRLLSLAAMHSDRLVNDELARVDARKWHYAVLATLDEFGAASQAQLSDRTRIYRSDLVAVLNELAEREQVERAPDPADKRRNLVRITTAGRRTLRKLDKLLAAVEDEVLAPLDPTQRADLTSLLTTLVDHHSNPKSHDSGQQEPQRQRPGST
ncbi:MarR family winged helix-turn-helix transcriptional regulator [Actinoplanes sp. TRM 88003]|uniref:MarR family winged helix-turn-helix transcriptional regulator n=1 Tax=Paractinoplanes aksuensis TaxID=2939490 RepID=A0ABT1DF03_9ACTN|nr:MarR family winged helix-turn-helix transcriptional regulator [Actinoplanes aksuensis]MCO8269390.1 MarR family winged helix-turn-helix transcriptional regulator [Actinoplanes aksuensis]